MSVSKRQRSLRSITTRLPRQPQPLLRGAVVRLRSGGHVMTMIARFQHPRGVDKAHCRFETSGKPRTGAYPVDTLQRT